MTTTLTVTQSSELCDVSNQLMHAIDSIADAVEHLLRIVGDLIGPASPDPESFDHTPPERRKPWT